MRRTLVTISLLAAGALACVNDPDPTPPDPSGTDVMPTIPQFEAYGECPAAAEPGTTHEGTIAADETWTAAGSPHHVTSNLDIRAKVTIEACARVLVAVDRSITVSHGGQLVTRGSAVLGDDGPVIRPVTIEGESTTAPWGQILVEADGRVTLAVTALRGGGATTLINPAALFARGVAGGTNSGDPVPSVAVDRVLIQKSATYGAHLDGWASFAAGSHHLTIVDSAKANGADPFPLHLEPGVIASLPTDLTLAGNATDEILARSAKTFTRDDTFVNRGLPYHVRGAIYVAPPEDGAPVTLTIEPGVTLGFEKEAESGLIIGSTDARRGQLVAAGTEAAPITLRSGQATPAPGDWAGLVFRNYTEGNRISDAVVLHAGAESGSNGFGCGPGDNDAAVIIRGQGPDNVGPASAFITNTRFDQLAGETVIVSGWYSDSGPDFSATNTFGAATPACKVSKPQRTGGGDTCDGGRDICLP